MLGRAPRCVLVGGARSGKTSIWLAVIAREPGGTVTVARDHRRPVRMAVTDIPRAGGGAEPVAARLRRPWLTGLGPWVIDTPSLPDGEEPLAGTGRAAAATLTLALEADAVLHVWDAAAMGGGAASSPLDDELARWGRRRPGYWILAAKMDAGPAQTGLMRIGERYPDVRLIPVAAATGRGIQALRRALRSAARR